MITYLLIEDDFRMTNTRHPYTSGMSSVVGTENPQYKKNVSQDVKQSEDINPENDETEDVKPEDVKPEDVKPEQSAEISDSSESVADTERDSRPSTEGQHSYAQRKRLLESVFNDLEETNRFSENKCGYMRGRPSYKL